MGEYIHPELQKKVEFFGGSYIFIEEGRLNYRGKEVLYLVGLAGIEASCCGTGGCAFIKVPGYVHFWKKSRNEFGQSISEIERIESPGRQREISKILLEKHPGFAQVEFL
ncbi:MAG: hypothetical protein FJ117_04295 [Deltaproteobacteria bacterium]|nr:hypothetical protein [Deltaproteobacteria bacterium]